MKQAEVYRETQYFRRSWALFILLGINAIIIYGIVAELVFDKPIGNTSGSFEAMLFVLFLMTAFTLLFVFMRLDTEIQHSGVYYRLYPFQRKFRGISKTIIRDAYVRKYNPIMEFGGWGIRVGWAGKGMAYNVSGNMGLQIEYGSGKKILLGTRNPEKVQQALIDNGFTERLSHR